MNLKKPTTFQQQVSLLRKKNLIIKDDQLCESFLGKVNYYRFSAYCLPFLDRNTNKCFTGTYFERLQNIYHFDQELRKLLFGVIENIEIHLRTSLAYYHAHKYGPEGYMYAANYGARHDHLAFLKRISSCIKEHDKTLVVKHHLIKYNGHFPIWVIIEYFSMGMLAHFYRNLLTKDKKQIARTLYGVTPEIMESWLRCLTDLRNICAHYSRIYYWIFSATPKMPPNETYLPTRRLFAQIYMLKLMYPDKSKWNDDFLTPLSKLIKKYKSDISLKHLDFPYRWNSLLKNKKPFQTEV